MKKTLTLIFSLFVLLNLSAQVHINEYSASNLNSFTDSFLRTEDWIELYNSSDSDIDISGWHISDKETNPNKWEIPAGTIIPANGFLIFWCSGRDGFINNEYHTNFKLAQSSSDDVVLLADASGTVLEQFSLQLTLTEHSRCRVEDGSNDWAVCTAPSLGTSNNETLQFLGYTQTPDIDLAAGFYEDTLTVSITNNDPNSVLRYTLDGSNPTLDSPEYTEPLTIPQTMVVKAQSFSSDSTILTGKMDFHTFLINENFSLAVFSVAANEVIELANGDGDLIPIGSLEYFNTDKELEATSFGSLNRHGQDSWVLPHRSIDWVSRDEMGYSKAVEAPLFAYSERNEYQKFMFRNSGDDNYPAIDDSNHEGSTHIRDEYVQALAYQGGMELDHRAVERVVLFLNGEYWGVYGMRERPVDHDYTGAYYNQGKYETQFLTTWGTTEIQYGGLTALTEWENLRDFILDSDMSESANYEIASDSINMLSLIDYMIVNLTVVASDWLNYNTGWWRGRNPDGDHKKWGYILWDLDATFDYYINYSGVPNISPDADPCDLEQISSFMDSFFGNGGGTNTPPDQCTTIQNGTSPYPADDPIFIATIAQDGFCCDNDWDGICQDLYDDLASGGGGEVSGNVGKHEKIFLKLLEENPTFKQLYYSRYADMMNTTYSCENMIYTLDSMLAVIEPEMPRQIDRWGGTLEEWQENVETLKGFIEDRCMLLDDGMLECYEELSGPYQLTLLAEPDTIGEIDLNTLDIESFPWSGEYFGGMENKIRANVFNVFEEDYQFSHWVSTSGSTIFPNDLSAEATITLTQNDTLTAVFKERTGSIAAMEVVINEVIASNDSTSNISDSNGQYEDWIELYNNTDEAINLSGVFLSDKSDDLAKWEFPSGTIIESDGYLIVWADEDGSQEGLHANFKLSKSGEELYLSDVDTTLIDSVVFGEQETNVAYARIPNGTGDFIFQATTFNDNNENVNATVNLAETLAFNVFPNPTNNYLTIQYDLNEATDVEFALYSIVGNQVAVFNSLSGFKNSGKHSTYVSLRDHHIPSGMYLLCLKTDEGVGVRRVSVVE